MQFKSIQLNQFFHLLTKCLTKRSSVCCICCRSFVLWKWGSYVLLPPAPSHLDPSPAWQTLDRLDINFNQFQPKPRSFLILLLTFNWCHQSHHVTFKCFRNPTAKCFVPAPESWGADGPTRGDWMPLIFGPSNLQLAAVIAPVGLASALSHLLLFLASQTNFITRIHSHPHPPVSSLSLGNLMDLTSHASPSPVQATTANQHRQKQQYRLLMCPVSVSSVRASWVLIRSTVRPSLGEFGDMAVHVCTSLKHISKHIWSSWLWFKRMNLRQLKGR